MLLASSVPGGTTPAGGMRAPRRGTGRTRKRLAVLIACACVGVVVVGTTPRAEAGPDGGAERPIPDAGASGAHAAGEPTAEATGAGPERESNVYLRWSITWLSPIGGAVNGVGGTSLYDFEVGWWRRWFQLGLLSGHGHVSSCPQCLSLWARPLLTLGATTSFRLVDQPSWGGGVRFVYRNMSMKGHALHAVGAALAFWQAIGPKPSGGYRLAVTQNLMLERWFVDGQAASFFGVSIGLVAGAPYDDPPPLGQPTRRGSDQQGRVLRRQE